MSLNDPTREEMGQQLLMDAQQEYIPQGGVSPEQYVNQQMPMQYQTPQGQAELYQGLLGAGYTDQEAKSQIGLLSPTPAESLSLKDLTQAQKDIMGSHETRIKATRSSLERFNEATDLIQNRGGFEGMSGEDDTSLITFFAQMQRPGEAMNEGDVAQILASAGLGDMVNAYTKLLKGEGRLSDPQRARIYNAMESMAQSRLGQYGDIRATTQQMIDPYQGQLGQIMRPEVKVDPYPINPTLLYTREQMEEEARRRGLL